MQLDGKLVAVPIWLKQVIKHYGLSFKDLFDISVLEKKLSKDDITNFYICNKLLSLGTFSNYEIVDSTIAHKVYPYVNTLKPVNLMECYNIDKDDVRICKMLNDIDVNATVFLNNVINRAGGKTNIKLLEMLSTKMFTTDANSEQLSNYSLELFIIDEGVYGLSVAPKSYSSVAEHYKDVLRMLCNQYKYEDVCKTQLFESWRIAFLGK